MRARRGRTRRGHIAALCASLVQISAPVHRAKTHRREFSSLSLSGMKTAKSIAPEA
jgi:hypothetical protein